MISPKRVHVYTVTDAKGAGKTKFLWKTQGRWGEGFFEWGGKLEKKRQRWQKAEQRNTGETRKKICLGAAHVATLHQGRGGLHR